MSTTLGGALKAYLEAQGLGITVFTDAPAPKAQLFASTVQGAPSALKAPYVVIAGDIAMRLDGAEDGAVGTGAEEIQLDLYQNWRDNSDALVESGTLADAVTEAIHMKPLPANGAGTAPKRVYAMRQIGRRRQLDRDARIVRYIYQIDIVRAV